MQECAVDYWYTMGFELHQWYTVPPSVQGVLPLNACSILTHIH